MRLSTVESSTLATVAYDEPASSYDRNSVGGLFMNTSASL